MDNVVLRKIAGAGCNGRNCKELDEQVGIVSILSGSEVTPGCEASRDVGKMRMIARRGRPGSYHSPCRFLQNWPTVGCLEMPQWSGIGNAMCLGPEPVLS